MILKLNEAPLIACFEADIVGHKGHLAGLHVFTCKHEGCRPFKVINS